MSYNPYEAPGTSRQAIGVLTGSRNDLRSVAIYQQGLLTCILVCFILILFQFLLPPGFEFLLWIAVPITGIAGAIFVFLLAMKTHGTINGVLPGILAILPILGLLILLLANNRANKILQKNGIRVGLPGAHISTIHRRPERPGPVHRKR